MAGDITLKNLQIFDGFSENLIDGDIRIVDGIIKEIGKNLKDSGNTVDLRGKFATPGLIDNHFHAYGIGLNMFRMETTPRTYTALKGSVRLSRALRRGFTSVRDVAGGDIGLASAISEGLIESPNYFYTGPALSQTGGHGDARPSDMEFDLCCSQPTCSEVVDGVENLRIAVRDRFRLGAHAIKIMASGGVVSLTDPIRIPQYSAEEILAVTEEAARRGSYVIAHAYSPEAIRHAVENGVRSIEHGNLIDEKTAQYMAKMEAVLVPTLVTYFAMSKEGKSLGMSEGSLAKNHEVLEKGKRAVELATQAGVLIGFGTDLMGDLESYQLEGLRHQAEVQSSIELLRSITSNNAAILGKSNLGNLKPGANGDVVVFSKSPIEHPSILWEDSSRIIVKAGRVVD
jgi:imidazolonepropionase-like amidohydrolase